MLPVEQYLEAVSQRLEPEAQYYWKCHQPRINYFVDLVGQLARGRSFQRILDIGMGYETLALRHIFPESTLDCAGLFEDTRYRPTPPSNYYTVDLNNLPDGPISPAGTYDLMVCMEVVEHLINPPSSVLRFLSDNLAPGGILIVTTPNAAWLKNRLKLIQGRNPFEVLNTDRLRMGHIREYTLDELRASAGGLPLEPRILERRGLYRFNNPKDRIYSWLADHGHSSLRRTLVAVWQKQAR